MTKTWLLVLLVCSVSANVEIDKNVIVTSYQYSESINAYTGIPYAQAPVDSLRFEPPQAIPKSTSASHIVNNRSRETVRCAQVSALTGTVQIIGEEDCLYLNVYVPSSRKGTDEKLPVMVYIHGGGFAWGTGTIYKPDYLLRDQNVILVTLNYRLGPLGFLAGGSSGHKIYGNNGLKDQIMAIQWVHENIGHFGGDNGKVTLFGNSAGGASTHFHLFTQKSKGLFHSAIIQSGGAFCHWAVRSFRSTVKLSAELSRLANCPTLPTTDMINCLKQRELAKILESTTKLLDFDVDSMGLFLPTVEPMHGDAALTDYPDKLIQDGKFYDVPIMQGVTTSDGAFRASFFVKRPEVTQKYDDNFHELYAGSISAHYLPPEEVESIRKQYFGDGRINQNNFNSLTNLLSAGYFNCTDTTVTNHHKHATSPIYNYLFDYKGALTFSKVFGNGEDVDLGVCHMDELFYLFPLEFVMGHFKHSPKNFEGDDYKMSLFMVKLWTHFATYKNFDTFSANGKTLLNWKPVQSQNKEYLTIDQDFGFPMRENFFEEFGHYSKMEKHERVNEHHSRDEL